LFFHGHLGELVLQAKKIVSHFFQPRSSTRTAVASALAVPAGLESDHVRFAMTIVPPVSISPKSLSESLD
jgi:hypothetical protein